MRSYLQNINSGMTSRKLFQRDLFNTVSHRLRLSSSSASLTPEEAGRRAEMIAMERSEQMDPVSQQQRQPCMATLLAHTGVLRHQDNTALAPALHMATTYVRPADGPYKPHDRHYTRMDNPTRIQLEDAIGVLETVVAGTPRRGNGVDYPLTKYDDFKNTVATTEDVISCAFSSGMMAASSIVLAHSAPLHVLLPRDLYHGVPTVLHDVFVRFGVTAERVDFTDVTALSNVLESIPKSSDCIVWMETPSNPLCHVIDISATCSLVRSIRPDTTLVVDSTLAPPTLTQPLTLGADLSLHSATKYLGGHSDVLCGCVTASPWTERGQMLGPVLKKTQIDVGGVASPMDAWLTMRGLRTLSVRVQRQCDTALTLARYLQSHSSVHAVHYPGLESTSSSDQYAIAKKQMSDGYGGVLSVDMESETRALALAGALRTIQRATSLGGTETLIEHRASIEPAGRVTSPKGLLRIAVGLEEANDLIQDLEAALTIVEELHMDEDM